MLNDQIVGSDLDAAERFQFYEGSRLEDLIFLSKRVLTFMMIF